MIIKRDKINDLVYITYKNLTDTGIVNHGFSTRTGGVSAGYLNSMNLSYSRGDEKSNVDENFRRMGEAIGFFSENLVLSQQTHTTNVRIVTEEDRGKGYTRPLDYTDVDGLITNVPHLVLTASFADCVPLFFVDPVHHAVGLSHSGWRGTVGKIGRVTVEKMAVEYGTRPQDLQVAIGPSICADCYEVSEDVAVEFRKNFTERDCCEILKSGKAPGKYQLDLWRANTLIFQELGISENQIEQPGICTCCNSEFLFSHRASNGKRGNLAAFLELTGE